MALVRVTCGSCGKSLGSYVDNGSGTFGISDMQQGERSQVDPDCASCNPNYHKICKNCRATAIDKDGICRVCKKVMKT